MQNKNKYQVKRQPYLSLVLFYFIFELGDIATTKIGLFLGAKESNPFVIAMLNAGLFDLAVINKLLIACLVSYIFILWSKDLDRFKYYTTYVYFLWSSYIVLNNSWIIIRILYNA